MKRKVLFCITKSNWGGAQRYVFNLANRLSKEEFEVVVALGGTGTAGSATGDLAAKLAFSGERTILVPAFARDVSPIHDIFAFFQLLHIFKNEKPDVVHLNSSKAVLIGTLAARVAGAPRIVATVHGWLFNEARPRWQKMLIIFLQWLSVVLAHKTIVVCDHDLQQAATWPFVKGKIVRIYNGIDTNLELDSGDIIRRAFPDDATITGTIGELTRNKNQLSLIEAAEKDPHMYVAIVGEGEERKNLEAAIKKYRLETRVKLFGFLPAREVLRGFDRFTLPSIKEGLPYALLEAKAAGLPLIANPVGGIPEILNAQDMQQFSLEHMIEETEKLYLS